MEKVYSPLTQSDDVKLIRTVKAQAIIDYYQNDVKIDVSKYFKDCPEVRVFECNKTGFQFYYPFNLDGDGEFYTQLSKEMHYYAPKRWENDPTLDLVEPGMNVLELGSGNGFFLESAKNKGAIVQGLELNEQAIIDSQKRGLNVIGEPVEVHAENKPNFYDIVCSSQVVEHIADVRGFIEASIKCVKPGGRLLIAVPNNDSHIFSEKFVQTLNLPPHHMGLWGYASLENLPLIFPDLEVENIITEESTTAHASEYYNLSVKRRFSFSPLLARAIFVFTRKILVNIVPAKKIVNHGRTILAIYTKK